mmetsp:Transcript_10782/g.9234  ORF Transcript_10782/g.9234 Transcript_10782/m.9234 type:complete len:93 (-) Transcript_10782:643-921(-)
MKTSEFYQLFHDGKEPALTLDYYIPAHLHHDIARMLGGIQTSDEKGHQLIEFLKGSNAETKKLHLASETEQKNALNLLSDSTMDLFLSIKEN